MSGTGWTTAITRIVVAQAELLDYTGHVNRGLPRVAARRLVEEINSLRATVGWPPLNMTGRWRREKSSGQITGDRWGGA